MARTIDTIYQELLSRANIVVPELTQVKSKTSISGLLLYICAVLANTVEKLFDTHTTEVEGMIKGLVPHRPAWYAHKALAFQEDDVLPDGEDKYAEIDESKQIVKRAVAIEQETGELQIKIAGEGNGGLSQLTAEQVENVQAYIGEIKDAGVVVNVTSTAAEAFSCVVKLYYNGSMTQDTLISECKATIKNYVTNLPFNGEYSNMALIDALQTLTAVEVVTDVTAKADDTSINVYVPTAGYFAVDDEDITIQATAR